MQLLTNPARFKVETTYNAAADHFDHDPLAFWARHGTKAVELLGLTQGEEVLDVGCGTGASAIPAAVAVGPSGKVTGIDLAENMLQRARAKAAELGLSNAQFSLQDMSDTGFADESFDAIIGIFSVFFVPDTEAQVAELWRMLRPGGQLLLTVWADGAFEPGASIFAEEIGHLRPDILMPKRPWERLTDERNLRLLCLEGGTAEPEIVYTPDCQPLTEPDDWWTIALGSGFRWEIEQLSPDQQVLLRAQTRVRLSRMSVKAIKTSALHAIARKPL